MSDQKITYTLAVAGAEVVQRDFDAVGAAARRMGGAAADAGAQSANAGASAADQANAAALRYIESLQRQADTIGKSEAELIRYRAAQLGVGEQAEVLVTQITQARDALRAKEQADALAIASAREQTQALLAQEQAQKRFIASLHEQVATQGMAGAELLRYRAAQLGVTEQAEPLIARLNSQRAAVAGNAMSAGELSQAMRYLPMQMTDVAVSLASGMPAWMVAIQQGGQLKDSFGGIGPAAKQVGAYVLGLVNPFTVAAVAAGALAYVVHEAAQEQRQIQGALLLAGGAAGLTANSYQALAEKVAGASKASIGASKDILAGLLSTGQVGAAAMAVLGEAGGRLVAVTGKSTQEVVQLLGGMAGGVASWAAKQNDAWHFLTAAQYEQVRALEQVGNKQQAMVVVGQALNAHLAKQEENLGYIEKAWRAAGNTASAAWDSLLGLGRPDTLDQELARVRASLAGMDKMRADIEKRGGTAMPVSQGYLDLKAQEQSLLARKTQQENAAKAEEERARKVQAQILANQQQEAVAAAQIAGSQALKAEGYEQAKLRIQAALDAGTLTQQQALAQTLGVDLASIASKRLAVEQELALAAKHDDTLAKQKQLRGQLAQFDAQAATAKIKYLSDVAAAERAAADARLEAYNQQLSIQGAGTAADLAEADSVAKLLETQQEHNRVVGLSAQALSMRELAKLEDAQATAELRLQEVLAAKASSDQIEAVTLQVEALRALVQAKREAAGIDAATDAAGRTKTPEPGKDTGLANMRDALTSLNSPLASLTGAYADLMDAQAKWGQQAQDIAAQMRGNDAQRLQGAQAQIALQKSMANGSLAAYATMTGAAKGLFKEHSTGYKVMETSEKAWRLLQLAESANVLPKLLSDWLGFTTAKVAGDQTMAASSVAAASVNVAASTAEGTAAAAAGIATQAKGDPYTAFGRMAAMAAAMAALGFATGGLGGGGGGADKGNTGTGTVLGDSSAASESLGNALGALADVDTQTMRYSAEMSASLRSIDSSMGGLAALLSTSGATTLSGFQNLNTGFDRNLLGDAVAGAYGNTATLMDTLLPGAVGDIASGLTRKLGDVMGNLFGSKTSITGSGLYLGATTLGDIQNNGLNARYYADTKTKNKAFGVTYSTSQSTQYQSASDEVNRQLELVMSGIGSTLTSSAGVLAGELGTSLADVEAKLASATVDIGKINLKDLSGEEIQAKLGEVFSAAADEIAGQALAGLEGFQQVGEGYYETVVRVAADSEQARIALQSVGVGMVGLADLADKQADVAGELVRESIAAKEGLTGVAEIMSALDGSASELVATYAALIDVRATLVGIGTTATDVTSALLAGAGGLQNLQDSLGTYKDKFLSEEERIYLERESIGKKLAALGYELPVDSSKYSDFYTNLVQGIDASTDAGQTLLGQVLGLAGGMSDLIDQTNAWRENIVDASNTLRDAMHSAIYADMTSGQKLADLQAQYAMAFASGTSGNTVQKEEAAQTMASLLPDILSAARETAGVDYLALRDSLLANADALASQLEVLVAPASSAATTQALTVAQQAAVDAAQSAASAAADAVVSGGGSTDELLELVLNELRNIGISVKALQSGLDESGVNVLERLDRLGKALTVEIQEINDGANVNAKSLIGSIEGAARLVANTVEMYR